MPITVKAGTDEEHHLNTQEYKGVYYERWYYQGSGGKNWDFLPPLTMPKTRCPRTQHGTKYDMQNTWERTRPSQPAVVGRDTGTAGSRGTDGPLFGRSGGACPGRRRSWWAARTVIKRNPTRSRPRTDVGVPADKRYQRSDDTETTQASTTEESNWLGYVEHTYHARNWKS